MFEVLHQSFSFIIIVNMWFLWTILPNKHTFIHLKKKFDVTSIFEQFKNIFENFFNTSIQMSIQMEVKSIKASIIHSPTLVFNILTHHLTHLKWSVQLNVNIVM